LFRTLSESAHIKVDGVWRELRAVLTTTHGGYRVVYLDAEGREVYTERAGISKFKEEVRKIKKEMKP